MSEVEGTVTISSIGGIDLILDADTNNIGEDQNARIVMRQDGGQVVGRMGYREGTNQLEIMQEWNNDLILGTNNQDRLTIDEDGFVGIGRSNTISAAEYFGVHAPVGENQFGGMYMSTNAGGWPFYGYSALGNANAFHYLDSNTGSWHLNNGFANRLTVTSDGNVGIGTTAPNKPLHVVSSEVGAAIFGHNTSVNPSGCGVWGTTNGPNGIGVNGHASANSGNSIAVYGQSNSVSGFDFFAGGVGQDYGS